VAFSFLKPVLSECIRLWLRLVGYSNFVAEACATVINLGAGFWLDGMAVIALAYGTISKHAWAIDI
jgi:hypothetical protein